VPKKNSVVKKSPILKGGVFLITLSLVFLSMPPLLAETLHVCSSCANTTIRSAIFAAHNQDTIVVANGVYPEGQLLVDKSLIILGENRPVVDGLNQGHVFLVKADHVSISGFKIQNSGVSVVEEFAGILADDVLDCSFIDNVLKNTTYAIYLAHVEGCRLDANVMMGNAKDEVNGGNGIHMWYSKKISIRNNHIQNHRDGIYLEFSDDCVLEGNKSVHNLRYGLHFMYSNRDLYIRNTSEYNQTGVAVMYSHHIVMDGNHFSHSWGRTSYGLLLKEIDDSQIVSNMFFGNTVGIYMDGVNRSQFTENSFRNNGWGVEILGSAADNQFSANNFMSNYFDVATNSLEIHNTFDGNYWDSYKGYDLNKDGVGDVPFRPMKVFSLWIGQYPELVALLESPVIDFLEMAERIFPVLTPKLLQDNAPRMNVGSL